MQQEYSNAEAVAVCFERLRGRFNGQAGEIIRILVDTLGGRRLTFPSRADLERVQRDEAIKAQFRGSNLQELALRHHRSPRQIRNILKK
jgi:Mor family transcriptional regulator